MKRMRNLLVVLLVAGIVFFGGYKLSESTGSVSEQTIHYTPNTDYDVQTKTATGFQKIAENSGTELYINPQTTEIELVNRGKGFVWYSNPQNRSSDTVADGDNKDQLSSQVVIGYTKTADHKEYYTNNYDKSILTGRYYLYQVKNGIGIRYAIGDEVKVYLRPMAISKERMDSFLSKMSAEDRATILQCYMSLSLKNLSDKATRAAMTSRYPLLKQKDLYILNGTQYEGVEPGKLVSQQISDIMESVGYTLADLKKDNAENQTKEVISKDYTIYLSVEYTLKDGSLVATIPQSSIEYNSDYLVLNTICFMPMFGAGDSKSNGYIFVPDGSGALIHFNNRKLNVPAYSKSVYADDKTVSPETTTASSGILSNMPVYGIKCGGQAFLAVIEKGDSSASLTADTSGKSNSYNYVYPTFTLRNQQQVSQSFLNATGQLVYQSRSYKSDLTIRYLFLDSGESDYTGMAKCYQKYLTANRLMRKVKTSDGGIPLYLDMIGGVDCRESILGIPYTGLQSLTSYSQARDILSEVKKDGIRNIVLGYSGALNGGTANSVFQKAEPVRALGGKAGLKKLTAYLAENNIRFYPRAEFEYVYKDKWADGFSSKLDASRTLIQGAARIYPYDIATLTQADSGYGWILSPGKYAGYIGTFLSGAKKYGINAIDAGSLSTDINSDFNKKEIIDRNDSLNAIKEGLSQIRSSGFDICADQANSYMLQYASFLTDVPMCSSQSYLEDEDIPFYQMVVHGYIPYSTTPLNLSEDLKHDLLKAAETGSSPGFEITWASDADLKQISQNIFSTNFSDWRADIKSIYIQLNHVLATVQGCTITGHKKIADNVFETFYSNGTAVLVNYNKNPVTVRDKTLEPQSFVLADGVKYAD